MEARAMIMPNIPGKVKCPECGSENIATKWTSTTIVSWLGKLLGVPMVRIYEKRCSECGKEFKVFRK
jgi:predicted nucleic-acid-binding Zn-ribbon protein